MLYFRIALLLYHTKFLLSVYIIPPQRSYGVNNTNKDEAKYKI